MKCPVDADVDLVMSERQGVEIDYCPKCRGVWLDRGELDKILERASQDAAAATPPPPQPAPPQQGYAQPPPQPYGQPQPYRQHGDSRYHDPYYGKKRKKSFLEELFG